MSSHKIQYQIYPHYIPTRYSVGIAYEYDYKSAIATAKRKAKNSGRLVIIKPVFLPPRDKHPVLPLTEILP